MRASIQKKGLGVNMKLLGEALLFVSGRTRVNIGTEYRIDTV
jgi:hypothetical protein